MPFHFPRPRRISLLTLIPFILGAGPALAEDVFLRHNPAHPETNERVWFAAQANGASIDKVELSYDRDVITVDAGGGVLVTRAESSVAIVSCDPGPGRQMMWCFGVVESGFPTGSLVTVRARSVNADGSDRIDAYQFAAGTYPLPRQPIPIRVTGEPAGRMDIIAIPDSDILDPGPAPLRRFKGELPSLVNDLYFKYTVYHGTTENAYRKLYNFYYTTFVGDYEETCSFIAPHNASELRSVGDALLILHANTLRDCKIGKLISSEIDGEKTLIHENGHVLFGLQDEYCCDSSYAQLKEAPNIWSSLSACETDAIDIGYAPSMCRKISSGAHSINFWRIDPVEDPGSIMGPSQRNVGSDHLSANLRRILWRFERCLEGNCFGGATTPPAMETAEDDDAVAEERKITVAQLEKRLSGPLQDIGRGDLNWRPAGPKGAAEPTINQTPAFRVRMDLTDRSASVTAVEPADGDAAQEPGGQLTIQAIGEGGTVLFETSAPDPRRAEIEGQSWITLDRGSIDIVVPAQDGLVMLRVLPEVSPINPSPDFSEHSAGQGRFWVPDAAAENPASRAPAGPDSGTISVDLKSQLSRLCASYDTYMDCASGNLPE